MDEARCGVTSQLVNGCAAHASRRLLTRHLKTCLLVTLFTSEGDVADIPFFPNPRAEGRARQAEEEGRRLAEEEKERARGIEESSPASMGGQSGHQTSHLDRKAQAHLSQESVKSVSSQMLSSIAEESNLSPSPRPVPVEEQENIGRSTSFIYGSVQGLVYGEHNTITLNFHGNEKRTVPFLAPPQPTYTLVGRDDLIRKLKQQLFSGGNLALSALNGIPGVGKTALALALAHDHEVLGYYNDGVLWAGLGREPNVFSYLVAWGLALSISPSEMEKITNITMLTQAVHRVIGTRRMLLVVDDAWSVEAALAFKLGGPYCAHLVTTRIPEVAETFAGDGTIIVQELGDEDGLTLLERLAPGIVQTAPDEARELVRTVGGLPLPLTLMGKYLRIQIHTGQPRRLHAALDQDAAGEPFKRLYMRAKHLVG